MTKKKKNSPLGGALDSIYSNIIGAEDQVTDINGVDEFIDVDIQNEDTKPEDDDESATEDENGNSEDIEVHDDDSKIPENVLNNINSNNEDSEEEQVEDNQEEEIEEVNPTEAQNIGAFFDAFAEQLNWDVDEEDKPKSVEELIDYIGDVVEQNSKPEYADDRIAQLDAYVRNGGRFEDFYNSQSQVLTYDGLDLEDESNQKAVVRDYMKLQGYNDEQINRKIERYEDNDMLEDEATDALDYLKKVQEQRLQQAQAEQEQIRIANEQRAREFITNLNSGISNLTNIRGIAVPKEDRVALYNYITRVDENGLTQYQKDFNQNMVNNLIESAYFTMKGDALLGTARREGQTSAVSKLRTTLRHQTKNHSSRAAQEEKAPQLWEVASKFLG